MRDIINKHELKIKQLKYKTMDTAKEQVMLNKKAEQCKTMGTAKKTRPVKQKNRIIQNNGCC